MLTTRGSHCCFFLSIILIVCNFDYVISVWPSINSSNVQLLGLFSDTENASKTEESAVHSRAMFKAALLLAQQYNITIDGKPIGWLVGQTGGNIINALGLTCQAMSSTTITGIVGPAYSRETHLVAQFAETTGIPVISYSATDPTLSDRNSYPVFYRTVPSDTAAAIAILKLFIRFNWTSCIVIYQNDAFGSGGATIINKFFFDNGFSVENLIVFDIATLQIQGNLRSLLVNSASRIVIVWAIESYTSIILQNALTDDVLGPHCTWILSSKISFSSFSSSDYVKLTGMLLIEPVTGAIINAPINSTLLNAAFSLWHQYEPETFPISDQVSDYGLFSFDATWSLIQSLQTLCFSLQNVTSTCFPITDPSYCFYRRLIHSSTLLDVISNTKFMGVSGAIQFSSNSTDRINGSYYSLTNSQLSSNNLSFIPVLDYSDDTGWKPYRGSNVIVWSDHSFVVPSDKPKLKGVILRIGIFELPPFTIVNTITDSNGQNRTEYIGFIPDLIASLQEKTGFIPDIYLAPPNQSYSQLILRVSEGLYDVVIADTTITAARRSFVDFSNSIFDNSLRLIIRQSSNPSIELLSFLQPFSRNLWLLVLAACLYAGALIFLAERRDNEALRDRPFVSQLIMSIWYAFGNILGYGVDFDVVTAAGRFITVSMYILGMILVASYTANLASDLTISKTQNIISGLDDLKSGKIPPNRVGIRAGTASEDFYLREVSGGIRNYIPLRDQQAIFDYLQDGTIDVALSDGGVAEYMINTVYCGLSLVGEEYDKGAFGIVMKKNWIYAQDLDIAILSVRESGILGSSRQKWFQKTNCPSESATSTGVNIESTSGLFIVFAVITFLSFVLILWKQRKVMQQQCLLPIKRKVLSRQSKPLEKTLPTSYEQPSATIRL